MRRDTWPDGAYTDVGLLREIVNDLPSKMRGRSPKRNREAKDTFQKKKAVNKMAKASRRRNRGR